MVRLSEWRVAVLRLVICTIVLLACPVRSREIIPADSKSSEILPLLESCVDADPGCSDYLRLGDSCVKEFMQKSCQKSCSLCGTASPRGDEEEEATHKETSQPTTSKASTAAALAAEMAFEGVLPRLAPTYDTVCAEVKEGCAFLIFIPSTMSADCLVESPGKEWHGFFNSLFGMQTVNKDSSDPGVSNPGSGCDCDVPVHYTVNPKFLPFAHAVMVSSLNEQLEQCKESLQEMQPLRPPQQMLMSISFEPPNRYSNNLKENLPLLKDSHGIQIVMSNDRYSDLPITHITNQYLGNFKVEDLFAPINITNKKIAIAAMYSNCGSGEGGNRADFLTSLDEHFPLHSFGSCHNTKAIPADKAGMTYSDRDMATKLDIHADYLFTLAYDNTEDDYNFSEKVWQSLLAGTIPVYWGAPIKDILPCKDCVIHLADFNSKNGETNAIDGDVARKVGAHLHELAKDPAELEKLVAWRTGKYIPGARPEFDKALARSVDGVHCRIAAALRGPASVCTGTCDDDCRQKNSDVLWRFDSTTKRIIEQ